MDTINGNTRRVPESRRPGRNSAHLVAALERCWSAIRARHPDIPAVVLIVGPGFTARQRKLGHFAAQRWHGDQRDADAANMAAEVLIGGEGLQRGARPVFATLLHEAAHALAHARDVRDTSHGGRYHNRHFKAVAEELGLEVERQPHIGWSATRLSVTAAATYKPVIDQLANALTTHRRSEPGRKRPNSNNPLPALCNCPRRIRVAPTVLSTGPITCGVCGSPFTATDHVDPTRPMPSPSHT